MFSRGIKRDQWNEMGQKELIWFVISSWKNVICFVAAENEGYKDDEDSKIADCINSFSKPAVSHDIFCVDKGGKGKAVLIFVILKKFS